MRAEPAVEVKEVSMHFHSDEGEIAALDRLSLEVGEREFVSIVGPSGCGKSTLLNIIAGLLPPVTGQVFIRDKPVSGPTAQVGYMLQSDQLFEWRSVWKNVLLGLEVQNKINTETKAFAEELLRKYGLLEFKAHFPRQLSGGMRQRAALIRTLATKPQILLLDEAFSALDYQTRLIMTDEVKQIIVKEGKTAILVTHDIAEAISMSSRVVVLTKRPGKIKNIHAISLGNETSPLKRREAPAFKDYFLKIWKELDVHV